jgi:phage tail-like protein
MATRGHDDDFQGAYFELSMDGLTLGWFTGCTGLTLEFDTITFKEGNGAQIIERKRPGKPKYEEIVLKRGFTQDKALYDWFDTVVQAADETPYKTGSIVIYDRTQNEVARFNMEWAWPSKLTVSDLSAGTDEVMVEELTIQHEFIDWVDS